MNEIADLQAQIIALRVAVEGSWLSLLGGDRDPAAAAARMKAQNVAAARGLDATAPAAAQMRDAVVHHTEHLWGSIEWQLQQLAAAQAK